MTYDTPTKRGSGTVLLVIAAIIGLIAWSNANSDSGPSRPWQPGDDRPGMEHCALEPDGMRC
jgi:hypothetical protein